MDEKESENTLNHEIVDQLVKDVGEDMIPKMMEIFFKEIHQRCESIDELLKSEDIEQIGKEAHAIKSSSGGVGAMLLSDAAKEVEHASRDGRHEDVIKLVVYLKPLALKCLDDFKKRFNLDIK